MRGHVAGAKRTHQRSRQLTRIERRRNHRRRRRPEPALLDEGREVRARQQDAAAMRAVARIDPVVDDRRGQRLVADRAARLGVGLQHLDAVVARRLGKMERPAVLAEEVVTRRVKRPSPRRSSGSSSATERIIADGGLPRSCPDRRHAVRLERAIVAHERRALDARLRHERAIERIGVMWRQRRRALGVRRASAAAR